MITIYSNSLSKKLPPPIHGIAKRVIPSGQCRAGYDVKGIQINTKKQNTKTNTKKRNYENYNQREYENLNNFYANTSMDKETKKEAK